MIMVAKRIHRGVVKVREACAPKRVVAGAMCESAAMEVVCVRRNGGCHRERGKPRDAERNEKRHLAVEVQEREDKRCSEKQGKGRRLSSTGVREQQHSAVMELFVYKLSMYSRGGISGLIRSMQKQPAPGLST